MSNLPQGLGVARAQPASEGANVLIELINCYYDYEKHKECEITERTRIMAQMKCKLAAIEEMKEFKLTQLKLTHEEKMRTIEANEKLMLEMMKNGNTESISACVTIIKALSGSVFGSEHQNVKLMLDVGN